ncbi:hypothetical protein CP556_01480 [Natrinema sp. CBA1119]|uniref:hypothetical protein n=1 Tax=Halobacteriales TaxID=2235 RepID=UPI000BF6B32D|nr:MULTISPECIES: hypothetical protein [Halobacteria]PGF14926.1 hypothetical protein CP556_01480 [Natrinema sp. CBA1119]
MGAGESSETIPRSLETVQERTQWIRDREIADTALRDFLRNHDKEHPNGDRDLEEHVAKVLNEVEFDDFRKQFRFGGKQSLNFFVLTGISDEFDDIPASIVSEFPRAEEVQDQKGEPFLVDTEEFDNRLYVILGRYVSMKTVDPSTGKPQRDLKPDECVAVINKDTDLVHVRTAEVPLARRICRKIASSVGMDYNNEDVFYKPSFDQAFVDEFSDQIEKYVNLNVVVNEGDGRTASSVRYTSKKDESGDYMNLLEDDQVQQELNEEDGEISKGYVKLNDGDFALYLNRPQSKIWFRSYEREGRLNEIEELINDVLRESGGYPQQKLQGFENIPE